MAEIKHIGKQNPHPFVSTLLTCFVFVSFAISLSQICGIKTIIHWLQGLRSNQHGSATSTLRLLTTYLKNEGDLLEKGRARYVLLLTLILWVNWVICAQNAF